jgi:hypothetical protein
MHAMGPEMRILFYTSTPRAFRTTLIGYLYELSQAHEVVLLSEELDSDTLNVINDRLFFHTIETVKVHQHTGTAMRLFRKHRYFSRLAHQLISDFNPDIVVASSDWHSLFEMYLLRSAKNVNILRVTLQDTFNIAEMRKVGIWVDLFNVHTRTPKELPLKGRMIAISLRKYFGHVLHYWIMPLLVGRLPFGGTSSYILFKGHSGSRDSSYHIVMSQRDYNIHIRSGVSPKKLLILPHPLTRAARIIFQALIQKDKSDIAGVPGTVAVMLPAEEIGFRDSDFALITLEEKRLERTELLRTLVDILDGWRILIKPHPATKSFHLLKTHFGSISDSILFVEPQSHADLVVEQADVIIEFPRASSTTLFSATIQCPQKPVFALDFQHEFLGDSYKDFPGVQYIDRMEDFKRFLIQIKEKSYTKPVHNIYESEPPNSEDICSVLNRLKVLGN